MTAGLLISFWETRKKDGHVEHRIVLVECGPKSSFGKWYLEAVEGRKAKYECEIMSVVPLTVDDVRRLKKAGVGV